MEYASKGVGTAALTLGTIGTVLSGLEGVGGISGLLGNRNVPEGDRPVTRYEMGLIKESIAKDNEITLLKAQQYTDQATMGIQGQIANQNAWNAAQMVNIQNLQYQLGQVVKPFVPNYSLAPGYGMAEVRPMPPFPPVPPVVSPATNSGGTTEATGN